MKTIVLSITMAAICLLGCRHEYEHRTILSRAKHHPTSAELNICPYGHATLKDVPIVYGLPDFADKVAMSNMAKATETFQVWPGGDGVFDDSPTVRVTCVTCGFSYSEFGLWSRSSSERGSFRHAFSEMVSGFPLPPTNMLVRAVKYSQSLQSNAVTSESVSYTSRESQPFVFTRMTNWLAGFKITKPTETILGHVILDGTKRNIYEWKKLSLSVTLHQEEDGASWVYMDNTR